ncbi:hypothetical protein BKI52_05430 [marine bacterium AO1-C]|nr:hypothetical protein BKI52_05430 [marine bacterium AO1-C]
MRVTLGNILIVIFCFIAGCQLFEKDFIFPSPVAEPAKQINAVSFVAHWKKVNGASSYEIDVALDEKFAQPVSGYQGVKVDTTFMVIANLDANTDYYYRVRTQISRQTSQNSNVIKVTTLSLNVPVAFAASDVTANSIRANWKAQSTATSYLLDIATNASFSDFWGDYKEKDVGLDTTLVVDNLDINRQYFYRIRVKRNGSVSEPSNIQSVFTSTLAAPKMLPVTDIQLTSFTINWEAVSEATAYQVDIARDALFSDKVANYDSRSVSSNSLTAVNLAANQTYYCRVRATNNNTTSNHSDIAQVETTNLIAPVAVAASDIQIGEFKANWQSVDNATVYLLEVATDMDFNNIVVNYDNIVTTEALVTGLEANNQYFYRVRAQGLNTISGYSNVIQTLTQALLTPTALAATNQTTSGFTVNWQSPSGATAYLLDISTDPNFTQFFNGYQNKEVTGNSLNITGIDFRQNYYYRIRAKRLSSLSSYSNTITVEACLNQGCKIKKLEIFANGSSTAATYSQTYDYDTQDRLITISQNNGDRYYISYNTDNTIKEIMHWNSVRLIRRYEYVYSANEMAIKSFWVSAAGNTGPQWEWVFTYDNQGRLINRKNYNLHTRVNPFLEFNFLYNEQGLISTILSASSNVIARFFMYDDKVSLYNLFHPGLVAFISNSTGDASRSFFPVRNIIFEQIWTNSYNYSFTYNGKGIAIEQAGDYIVKFTLEGCNF